MRTPPETGPAHVDDPLRSWVESAQRGDRAALPQLLAEVGPSVVRTCRRILSGRSAEAEEVAQQALMGFIAALPSFRGHCSVKQFAVRIAVLKALNARRNVDCRERLVPRDEREVDATQHAGPSPLSATARAQLRHALEAALDCLPEPQAEVLALHLLFEHTLPEISAMIGVPLETVRSRLRLGKKRLRERLEAELSLDWLEVVP